MSAPDFELTAGDTQPAVTATLADATGAAVNLTGATVRFRMRRIVDWVVAVDAPATVIDAPAGRVAYAWLAGDTAAPGDFAARWLVTWNGGGTTSYPSGRDLVVRVKAGA